MASRSAWISIINRSRSAARGEMSITSPGALAPARFAHSRYRLGVEM